MVRFFLVFLALAFVVPFASAQRGQGGQGFGGGFGGSMGGTLGGQAGSFEVNTMADERTLFLTPSDRTEWTFDGRENETVFVRVTSAVFDPAVAVHDESNTKLAENDDIAPGNQMAALVFSVPKPGKYRVVVTNYKGTAGGAFQLRVRRFTALPLTLGEARRIESNGLTWARIQLPRGGDHVITIRGEYVDAVRVVRSNGEPLDVSPLGVRTDQYVRARATLDAPETLFINLSNCRRPVVRVAPIVTRPAKVGETVVAALTEDLVAAWSLDVPAHEVVEVVADAERVFVRATSPQTGSDDEVQFTVLPTGANFGRHVVRTHRDQKLVVSVWHETGAAASPRVTFRRTGRPMPIGPAAGQLGWFDAEFWTFDAKAGDVVRLRASSPVFVVYATLFDPKGGFSSLDRPRQSPESLAAFTVPFPGKYVLAVSGGGIGPYALHREVVGPKRLGLGAAEGTTAVLAPDVWRLSAKRGQDLVIRIAADRLPSRLTLIGPDGTPQNVSREPDLLRLRVTTDGDYTLVVETTDGTPIRYRLKVTDLNG